ncbi:MAG: hypothetical protein CM15mP71_3750 [Candidatus Poseidoniales archaeon]|nr:MAG: hypothetical protein CM15mP71_3750 [Candidatus Poseidoniales archaeon]
METPKKGFDAELEKGLKERDKGKKPAKAAGRLEHGPGKGKKF